MTKALLTIHVLAAIIAIGPVTLAASMFPAAARCAAESGADRDRAVVSTLHRLCRVYAGIGIVVPAFGFATASAMHVLGDGWVMVSIALTVAAAAVLGLMILPGQAAALIPENLTGPAPLRVEQRTVSQLAMYTGVFNVLWVIVTILMIVRPGSTTGA
ncbi:hypothetical protein D7D52_31190 [Nocardia yunnanensis]|uniref:DUF2269 family protein n=1 Tax=Nocardia yunnanensis TaxID=2382165 RepID=A0A386ZJD7_9NOCA|nr:hypothetical protein [Nocardia yunnanensis]AYF77538.1 hypothetical protein D7D52_31190 [Nocardia yunnanensis]